MFNIFEDGNSERQTVYVGSFDDLKTQKIKRLGGIPVDLLERTFGKSFDGTITGFIEPTREGDRSKVAGPVSSHVFLSSKSALLSRYYRHCFILIIANDKCFPKWQHIRDLNLSRLQKIF